MSTSQKTKSLRGNNGPDEKPLAPLETLTPEPELTPLPDLSNDPIILNPAPDSSPEPVPAVEAAAGCVEKPTVPVPLSVSDLKLARQMNKTISGMLGLSRKFRSVKV
jgi:hypothetical protein